MNDEQARLRLGLDEDASPRAVLRAHHELTSLAVRLPLDARADVLRIIDEARDTLLGLPQSRRASALVEILATPRGMAALTAGGVLLAGLSLVVTASVPVLGAIASVLLGLGLWVSVRRRKLVASVLLAVAVIASAGLVVRTVANPGRHAFFYGGQDVRSGSPSSPFARQVGIPLTTDPATGGVDQSVLDEPTTFAVSCVKPGAFQHRYRDILWAYVADGDYETYWVPVAYLAALQPGAARTLLPCSDWRWQLQNFGKP